MANLNLNAPTLSAEERSAIERFVRSQDEMASPDLPAKYIGHLNAAWFRQFTSTDSEAIIQAIAYLKSIAVNQATYYQGSRRLFVPEGQFNMGTTPIELSHTFIFEGESSINGYGTRLKWSGDCDGLRVQAYNTTGTTTTTPGFNSASYVIIRNIGLAGPYQDSTDFTGHTEADCHGIRVRSNVIIEDCRIDGFAGDGVYALTSSGGGGAEEGNSNCSFINRLGVMSCRNGVYIDGADSNAWVIQGVIANYCRQHAVWDSSFLGNLHIGHHTAVAGLVNGVAPSVVTYLGNRYAVVQGQAAGASTNAPSGTTADNQWWLYNGAGGVSATRNINTWTSGTTYREGGGYRTDNINAANQFLRAYQESGEGPSQFVSPTIYVGGTFGARDPVTTGNMISGSALIAPNGVALGKTRIATINTSQTLALHNNQANSGGVYALLNFEQGVEADGVTPQLNAQIKGRASTNSPATAAGLIEFTTRTVGGAGGQTTQAILDGTANLTWRPNADNNLDIGLGAFRWKTGYFYTVDATTAVTTAGSVTAATTIKSTGPASGIGYATGAGGAVTQLTSKATSVQVDKVCGAITTHNAALAANTTVTFTVTDSAVAATDAIILTLKSGNATAGTYEIWPEAVAAGSFKINVRNISAGSLSEALVINFAVIKAVAS